MKNEHAPCYILPDEPQKKALKDSKDPFHFQPFVDTFASLVGDPKNHTPFTIVIDGKWGTGKTSLMEMTKTKIDERNKEIEEEKKGEKKEKGKKKMNGSKGGNSRPCKTFWFNAWKYSRDDQLLTALLLEMFKVLEQDSTFWETIQSKIDGKTFMTGVINKYFGQFVGGDSREYFHELRLKKNAAFLDEFTDLTKNLIQCYCSKGGKDQEQEDRDSEGAFVIFIDDLDRCPPSRILQVLEAIKLFLDIPGCIFFLGMEVEMVNEAINIEYKRNQGRKEFEAEEYLEKIFQLRVRLPQIVTAGLSEYIDELFTKVTVGEDEEIIKNIFLNANYSTQRGIKRAINDFLFLDSLTGRMKHLQEIKVTTPTGLAKWIAMTNLPEDFRKVLLSEKLIFLAFWEAYRFYKKTKKDVVFVWELEKIDLNQFITKKEQVETTGSLQRFSPQQRSETENLLHEFFQNWSQKPCFNYGFIAEGSRTFKVSDIVASYKTLNNMVMFTADEEKFPTVNGYEIKPNANLVNADFEGADLRKANLKGAQLRGANFTGTDLLEANLEGADLKYAVLSKSILRNINLKSANLSFAQLREADLGSAELEDAILLEADLTGAKLNEADLKRATLIDADLSGADLRNADFTDANVREAKYSSKTKFSPELNYLEENMNKND